MTKEGITPEGARNEEVPEMRRSKGLNALLASLATFVLCLGMGLLGAVPARAHEAVDVSRTGSITVFMVYEGEPVGGGSLTLYRVGEVAESDGKQVECSLYVMIHILILSIFPYSLSSPAVALCLPCAF